MERKFYEVFTDSPTFRVIIELRVRGNSGRLERDDRQFAKRGSRQNSGDGRRNYENHLRGRFSKPAKCGPKNPGVDQP